MALAELPEGTVTLLFTDVEGSTAMRTGRGDDAAQAILRAHEGLIREQVAEYGGHEIKALGDGFLVGFASARKAVACSVAIQRTMDHHARLHPGNHAIVRIGLNSGEVARENGDLMGAAVNLAARITAKADGGQILVSGVVKDLAGLVPDASYANRGRFRLKGFPERWQLFEVVWRQDAEVAAPAILERSRLVGRDAERSDLLGRLAAAASGRGGLVMIGGEPGIGKTRLTEEIRLEAEKQGFRALVGHCLEMEGGAPYWPFVEILESAIREVDPETLRAALGDTAPEVARIVPHIRRLFPDIPAPLELPPEQERRYLFNSIHEFLARAAAVRPQLLVLDDLHWADEPTLLLLQKLVEGVAELPVLLVGTYRDVELDVGRPLARVLEAFLRSRLAHRITLRGLSIDAVALMLQTMAAGQPAPPKLVDVIFRETEGNPFFVEEVFQHLAEEGKLLDSQGHWHADLEVSDVDVPEGIRLVVGRRLERLTEEGRKCFTTAAVVGRTFTYRLLEAAVDLDPDAVLDAVDAAERAHLITAIDEGQDVSFAFSHELIRQTLLANVSMPRRQRLHLSVADAVERSLGPASEDRATELAHHLYLAGEAADPARAAKYMVAAGTAAMDAAAYEDALRHFEHALDLHGWVDDRGHADAQVKKGLAQMALGGWVAAMETLATALDQLESLGELGEVASVCRSVAYLLGWQGRFQEALEIGGRGLSVIGNNATEDRCVLLSFSGALIAAAGGYDLSKEMLDEALLMVRKLDKPAVLATVLSDASLRPYWFDQMEESVKIGLEAVELLRAQHAQWELANQLGFIQLGMISSGQWQAALALHPEVEELSRKVGHYGAEMCDIRTMFLIRMSQGDFAEAERLAQEDMRVCLAGGLPWYRDSHLFAASCRFVRGDWDGAADLCRKADTYDIPYGAALAPRGARAMCLAYLDRRSEALALIDALEEDFPTPGQPSHLGYWQILMFAAEALMALDELDRVAALYPVLRAACEETTGKIRWFDIKLVDSLAGAVAAVAGERQRSELHFARARKLAETWGPRLVADCDYFEGWTALKRGDGASAKRLLTDALEGHLQLGMPRHVGMIEGLLAGT